MTANERQAFCEIVLGFAELKGKALSPVALELYWRSMQAWPIEEFKAAAEQLLRTCAFMPMPKDFEDLRKASRPTTGEAWTLVLEHARSGAYRRTLLSAQVERVVRMLGGWPAVAMQDTEKLGFLERRFCEHYGALQDAEDTRAAVPMLAQPTPRLARARDTAAEAAS